MAKARELDPEWDSPDRVEQRAQLSAQMTARISQIENGQIESVESLRAYVTGLGGRLDIVATIGDVHLNVA